MSGTLASALAEATIRTATPLLLAASGELLVERAGLINIGLEGVILGGAFGALVGATHGGNAFGYATGAAAGILIMLVFAAATLGMGADQIITGTAITLLALGATGTLYRTLYGASGAALSIQTSSPLVIPLLARLPVVGVALFAQPAVTYFAYAVVPLTWWWFKKTHAGLALRAIGEYPAAAIAAGISVRPSWNLRRRDVCGPRLHRDSDRRAWSLEADWRRAGRFTIRGNDLPTVPRASHGIRHSVSASVGIAVRSDARRAGRHRRPRNTTRNARAH